MLDPRPRYTLTQYLSREEIAAGVRRLAAQICKDYQGRDPLLVGVLRGAFVFMADLVRELDMTVGIEFVACESYRSGTESSGHVKLTRDVGVPIAGRHVLLVEDIVDTGRTTAYMLEHLKAKGAASVKLCALLDKPTRRVVPVTIDYLGFTVPDRFLVGYGLDVDQQFRHLPAIFSVEVSGDGP